MAAGVERGKAEETEHLRRELESWRERAAQYRAFFDAVDQGFCLVEVRFDESGRALEGYELARRIREKDWGAGMSLFAATGWGQERDKRLAREAGFDEHLIKPIDATQLQALILRHVSARAHHNPGQSASRP